MNFWDTFDKLIESNKIVIERKKYSPHPKYNSNADVQQKREKA
jgi:hypothetical protein